MLLQGWQATMDDESGEDRHGWDEACRREAAISASRSVSGHPSPKGLSVPEFSEIAA